MSRITKLNNDDFAKICVAVDRFREHLGRNEAINTINAIIAERWTIAPRKAGFHRCNIADPEKFGGSVAEYEFANGKADAYSDAIHWVKLYFEAQSK